MSAAYPNCALSAGAMVAIALTVLVTLTIWLGSVYLAAREPAHAGRPAHASEPGPAGEPAHASEPGHTSEPGSTRN